MSSGYRPLDDGNGATTPVELKNHVKNPRSNLCRMELGKSHRAVSRFERSCCDGLVPGRNKSDATDTDQRAAYTSIHTPQFVNADRRRNTAFIVLIVLLHE